MFKIMVVKKQTKTAGAEMVFIHDTNDLTEVEQTLVECSNIYDSKYITRLTHNGSFVPFEIITTKSVKIDLTDI